MRKSIILGLALFFAAAASPASAEKISWYGIGDGSGTHSANNKKFNPYALGTAHRELAFGTMVRFTYKGKSACVPVMDRGPFKAGRSFDVTYGVAKKLGFVKAGVVNAKIKIGC